MTFKVAVDPEGRLPLGDAAHRAGFAPGQLVEIVVTSAGSLILARDDAPEILTVPFRPLPSRTRTAPALAPAASGGKNLKLAAAMARIPEGVYRMRYERGQRYCGSCRDWHPMSEMGKRRSSPDGLDNVCRAANLQRTYASLKRKAERERAS